MGLSLTTWVKIFTISLLFTWLFYIPCLRRLWIKTRPFYGDPNWGHSAFIPIVGLYFLYLNREQLLSAKIAPLLGGTFSRIRLLGGAALLAGGAIACFVLPHVAPESILEYAVTGSQGIIGLGILALLFDWGIGTLIFGLLVFTYGIYPGQNDWVKDLGMIIVLFGVVLTLCGWDVMKIAWFPIVFLICALPWPGLVYSKIAMPLQNLAASVAVGVLNVCGAESMQAGTKIIIERGMGKPPQTLNVAEACAGMRSLMTFISVGATMAFLSARPFWQRAVLTLSAIPIAIFCNVMRVAGQGLLDHYVSEQLSAGFAHQFVGMVMLVPAFFLILGVGWILDQIFIEEIDAPAPKVVKAPNRVAPASSDSLATAPRRAGLVERQ